MHVYVWAGSGSIFGQQPQQQQQTSGLAASGLTTGGLSSGGFSFGANSNTAVPVFGTSAAAATTGTAFSHIYLMFQHSSIIFS